MRGGRILDTHIAQRLIECGRRDRRCPKPERRVLCARTRLECREEPSPHSTVPRFRHDVHVTDAANLSLEDVRIGCHTTNTQHDMRGLGDKKE